MCGIAGIAGMRAVNKAAVQAMTDLMAHRGPDGEGQWQSDDGQIVFGHRRLAIIDITEKGAQPMRGAGGDLTITYNGEIYNYRELRDELRANGVQFSTDSDTEVLLNAYACWGEACLDKLNGMFAFAIHDARRDVIFCARDRFGEKPFLYTEGDGFFAFASEYKALLSLEGVSSVIDDTRLMAFFINPTTGLDQENETVFAGVRQLAAGEKLTLNLKNLNIHREAYWTVPAPGQARTVSPDDAANQFKSLLEDSIKLRMRSDVPLGSCLSGGLDSSAITCIANTYSKGADPYHVFTGRFPDSSVDEGEWAALVAAATGVTQHETFPDGDKLLDDLDEFIWMNELPVDSASQYAQWSVFRLARENGVTVLLDGQGSDEILAGYEQYFANYIVSRKRDGGLDQSEIDAIKTRYPLALSMEEGRWKSALPFPMKKLAATLTGRGSDLRLGMKPEMASRVVNANSGAADGLLDALRRDAGHGFLATLLRYGDRNSMAHSREVRLPFCDHRLVEFVMTMPVEILMGQAETKHLLRLAMRDVLPEQIRTRWLKQGFLPPISAWLKGQLGNFADELFSRQDFQNSAYWDAAWWQQAFKRFRGGEESLATSIWKPMICQAWLEGFVAKVNAMQKHMPLN